MKKLILFATSFLILSACQKDPRLIPTANKTGTAATLKTDASAENEKNSRCYKGQSPPTTTPPVLTYCGPVTIVNLMAGQFNNIGTVSVGNNSTSVYVTYTITNTAWKLNNLSLYVGDCNLIPRNMSGNPIPGQFPYKTNFSRGVLSYTFTIPISALPDCYCVAAHASVSKQGSCTETAWGAGTRFVSQGNWGTYFSTCRIICEGAEH